MHLAESWFAASGMSGAFPTPALIRVDGNLDNILRDAHGRLTFVDWEYSGAGDPAYDLAELRWHPGASHLPDAWWDIALDSYTPLPDDAEFSTAAGAVQPLAAHLVGESQRALSAGRRRTGSRLGRAYADPGDHVFGTVANGSTVSLRSSGSFEEGVAQHMTTNLSD